MLKKGDKIPSVLGLASDGSEVKASDFAGKPLVIYFYLLLSDHSTEVNQAFGVWQLKKMAGREYMGTVRTTFITDADHVITEVITKVDTKKAADQLLPLL